MIGRQYGIAFLAFVLPVLPVAALAHPYIVGSEVEPGKHFEEIGRASCRERVL